MKALVTGFDPFGGDAINPSFEAVRRLPARIATLEVVTAELPTSFKRALPKLRALIKREQPDIVLCVGLAADRAAISIEKVAVNWDQARIADNDGAMPVDRPIVARAPAAYFSTLPVAPIVDALTRAGLRAEMSMSAGTFVCNHVFYGLMHYVRHSVKHSVNRAVGTKRVLHAGFVHVPALPNHSTADSPSREAALSELTDGLKIVLDVTRRRIKRK
jgi:pyroglutamyl-peptidase